MPSKLTARRPVPGPARDWDFPTFTKTRLDNGLQLITANTPGRTFATAELVLEAGATNEPEGDGGIGGAAAQVLVEGTENHKGPAFVQALEVLGANIDASCTWDSFKITMTAPTARLEPALELFGEIAQRPQFPWKEVGRAIQQRLGLILQEYAQPTSRATIAFNKLTYTPDSPYYRSALGDFSSVSNLGKRKVRKYFRNFGTPGSATLVLVGDLEGFPAEKVLERVFGNWKGKEPERTEPAVRDGIQRTAILLVDRLEAEQSNLQIGHIGAARTSPDYFPILVMSTALGGIFSSRLNRILREEKGYTYGIQGSFAFRRQPGPFAITTAVDTAKTADAVIEIDKVVRDFHQKGLTEEELDHTKGFLSGVFTLQFETPETLASALSNLVIYGLPDDYYETYRKNIEKVTLEDANGAAARYLRPEQLGVVVVGDAEKIGEPLRETQVGPVTVLEDPEPGEPPIH